MDEIMLIKDAGLTEGEAKVYVALLQLGESTTGPIIEKSKIANSIIYKILDGLIFKGLVSYIIKEKTKHFRAASPKKILDYIEERKNQLDESKSKIESIIPRLIALTSDAPQNNVQMFEGFKGLQTAWELMYIKLQKGEEYHSWGVYPIQDEKFHLYWQRDHVKRSELKIKGKILFNQGTDKEILKNRNSYWGLDARYMPTRIKTPAWFAVFKDTLLIALQTKNVLVVVIENMEIAETFEAYFKDLWNKSKPFNSKITK